MLVEKPSDIVLLSEVVLVDQVNVLLVLLCLRFAFLPDLAEVIQFLELKLRNPESVPGQDRAGCFREDQ